MPGPQGGWSGICAWLDAEIYQPVNATDFGPDEDVAVEMVDLGRAGQGCLAGQPCREEHLMREARRRREMHMVEVEIPFGCPPEPA